MGADHHIHRRIELSVVVKRTITRFALKFDGISALRTRHVNRVKHTHG